MSKVLNKVRKLPWIAFVDDERRIGNSIIVTLKDEYYFVNDPGCGVQGFDTVKEVLNNTRKKDVYIDDYIQEKSS